MWSSHSCSSKKNKNTKKNYFRMQGVWEATHPPFAYMSLQKPPDSARLNTKA